MRVRWGQVLSRSLGTGVCTSSLSRSSVWGLGGLPLQVAPCCLHPWRGGLSAPHPAGGETSAQGAGPGAELLWRLMAVRPQGRQEVGQDLGHRAWRAQPGLPPPGASRLSPLTLARGVQSGAWGPGAPPLLSLGPGRSTPPWGGADVGTRPGALLSGRGCSQRRSPSLGTLGPAEAFRAPVLGILVLGLVSFYEL